MLLPVDVAKLMPVWRCDSLTMMFDATFLCTVSHHAEFQCQNHITIGFCVLGSKSSYSPFEF